MNVLTIRVATTATLVLLLASLVALPPVARAALAPEDDDLDGIPDVLELALAKKYFPTLNLHCGTYEGLPFGDRRQLYGHAVPGFPDSSNGRIPFVAHPFDPGSGTDCAEHIQCIEIRYGIAWNWDLGDDAGGGGHRGDSEVYAVLLARKDTNGSQWGVSWSTAKSDANQWRLMQEFRSAHWGAPNDSSTVRGLGNLGRTTHQRVWCAEGKHAMYASQSACNNGGCIPIIGCPDDCSDNRCDIRSDVYQDVQNAGEVTAPIDPIIPFPAPFWFLSPVGWGSYDIWSGQSFGSGSADPYKKQLTRPIDWCQADETCEESCDFQPVPCPDGYEEVGGCYQDCGFGPEQGGTLCRDFVQCF